MNGFRDQLVDSLSGVNGDITIYNSNKDKIKKIKEKGQIELISRSNSDKIFLSKEEIENFKFEQYTP